jgi:hypothetical protein
MTGYQHHDRVRTSEKLRGTPTVLEMWVIWRTRDAMSRRLRLSVRRPVVDLPVGRARQGGDLDAGLLVDDQLRPGGEQGATAELEEVVGHTDR